MRALLWAVVLSGGVIAGPSTTRSYRAVAGSTVTRLCLSMRDGRVQSGELLVSDRSSHFCSLTGNAAASGRSLVLRDDAGGCAVTLATAAGRARIEAVSGCGAGVCGAGVTIELITLHRDTGARRLSCGDER